LRTFYPTDEEFNDPVAYIENIAKMDEIREAGGFKIKAPQSF